MEKEMLEKKIDAWIETSEDENFDAYLKHMKEELSKPDVDIVHMEENFRKNLELYWKNQETRRKNMELEQKNQQMHQSMQEAQQKMTQQTDAAEFKVGAGVLSVVGAVFILIALIILGKEFLTDFLQGMVLYICALAVILFSELFLYSRQAKVATVFTGIGIGSLYLITWINYQFLAILPSGMAIGIAAVIGISGVLLGQKRDGAAIRIINTIGICICVPPLQSSGSLWQFVTMAGMIAVVNIMSMFITTRLGRTAAELIQIICMGLWMFMVGALTVGGGGLPNIAMEGYTLLYLVLMMGIFLKMKKEAPQLWVWGIFTLILSIGVLEECDTWLTWMFLGIFVVFFSGICWIARKEKYKEVLYGVMSVVLTAAVQVQLPGEIDYIIAMGLLLGLTMLFLLVPQFQMEKKNVIAWITLGILALYSLLLLADETASGLKGYEYWTGMLIGIIAIQVLMRERFGIKAKWRGITQSAYFTYMFLMGGFEERLLVSVLLMAVAISAIAAGFALQERAVRIYGLSLAMIVCLKMVLWDFWGEPALYKMLAFLIVGILALVISIVYIVLEKKIRIDYDKYNKH